MNGPSHPSTSTPSASHPSTSTRRRFLAASGLFAGAGSLAGCLAGRRSDYSTTRRTDATGTTGDSTDESLAAAASWPQFGNDLRNSGHAPSASGPKDDAALAWRFDAGTPTMNASPVVADGTVYVPGSGDPGYVHALDAATGESVWRFEPAGYATCAPAFAKGALYFGTWGRTFYALDAATGEVLWKNEVGHRFGSSSPAVADGTVYVGTNGDGPLVVSGDDDEEFESGAVLALDAATGTEQWRYDDFGEKDDVESSMAVADGRVYFGGENAVHSLDAGSGSVAWSREISTHADSSPAVVDGTVYYGATLTGDRRDESDDPARLWALDAATGETVWSAAIADTSLRISPAVADGTVYVAASSVRACTGVGGGTEDGESNCSGTNRGRLYAVDAASGDRQWTAEFQTDTRSSPAVADGVVYVGNGDGIAAVTTDGENLWRIAFEGKREGGPYVKSSPAVADGRVFVGASDGRLRAIGA